MNKACDTCKHAGNFIEFAANGKRTYCDATGDMVFIHTKGDCFAYVPKGKEG